FEVINRFVAKKLKHLCFGCRPVHVCGQRRTVVICHEVEEGLGEVAGLGRLRRPLAQRPFKVFFQLTAHTDNVGIPFQVIGYIVEAAMVLLIHGPQRKLGVLRAARFRGVDQPGRVSASQRVNHSLAQRPATFGAHHWYSSSSHHRGLMRESKTPVNPACSTAVKARPAPRLNTTSRLYCTLQAFNEVGQSQCNEITGKTSSPQLQIPTATTASWMQCWAIIVRIFYQRPSDTKLAITGRYRSGLDKPTHSPAR